jgi:hypothetical protein
MRERGKGRRNAFGIPCRLQRQEKHEPGIYFLDGGFHVREERAADFPA